MHVRCQIRIHMTSFGFCLAHVLGTLLTMAREAWVEIYTCPNQSQWTGLPVAMGAGKLSGAVLPLSEGSLSFGRPCSTFAVSGMSVVKAG
ncbi:hypothetical protein CLAIMM_08216 [Cladophialophora immunda]|nr:hypothetical protein CLAIMM_08216 [Cladophialophora immunda]